MEKRSYSVVLTAAFVYFVLLGFTDGQFFPGKVFPIMIMIIIILVLVFEVGFILIVCCFRPKKKQWMSSQINWKCLICRNFRCYAWFFLVFLWVCVGVITTYVRGNLNGTVWFELAFFGKCLTENKVALLLQSDSVALVLRGFFLFFFAIFSTLLL